MRTIIIALCLAVAGCAQVKYADGQRVALEHDIGAGVDEIVQKDADAACLKSGGKAPAVRLSSLPVTTVLPAWMTRHVSTFRCG